MNSGFYPKVVDPLRFRRQTDPNNSISLLGFGGDQRLASWMMYPPYTEEIFDQSPMNDNNRLGRVHIDKWKVIEMQRHNHHRKQRK
jgi:hypothetical protein